MSVITDVMLCVSSIDTHEDNRAAWAWLLEHSDGRDIVRCLMESGFVTPHAGGLGKVFTEGVYLCAINFRTDELEALADDLDQAPWTSPEAVRLYVTSGDLPQFEGPFRPINKAALNDAGCRWNASMLEAMLDLARAARMYLRTAPAAPSDPAALADLRARYFALPDWFREALDRQAVASKRSDNGAGGAS